MTTATITQLPYLVTPDKMGKRYTHQKNGPKDFGTM